MVSKNVILITGANRGIGRAMTAALLLRPSTTVVATVRDPNHDTALSLSTMPTGSGSELILLSLDMKDVPLFASVLRESGIDRLDVVISNAGLNSGFDSVSATTPQSMRDDFEVNVVGTLSLFQICQPLLEEGQSKKFNVITSSVGSIKGLEMENMPGVSYGTSKAAVNWVGKKLSVEYAAKGYKIGIIHPGWVQTDMGHRLADAVGYSEPPLGVDDSARQVLERIDELNSETSGRFQMYDGQELPW